MPHILFRFSSSYLAFFIQSLFKISYSISLYRSEVIISMPSLLMIILYVTYIPNKVFALYSGYQLTCKNHPKLSGFKQFMIIAHDSVLSVFNRAVFAWGLSRG